MSVCRFILASLLVLLALPAWSAVDPHAHHRDPHANHRADAADPHAHHRAQARAQGTAEAAAVTLEDEALVSRSGETVQFRSQVVADHIVAINFMYTTCTTVCPVTSALFAQLQNKLGTRLGDPVRLVSVSVDPVRDTPERLGDYAGKMSAGEHWQWLTGNKLNVDEVLKGLGAYTPDFRDHPAVVIIGDARSNQWRRFYGFPSPDDMIEVIDGFIHARNMESEHGAE